MVCNSLLGSSELCQCRFCYLAGLVGRNKCIVCGSCSLDSFLISGFDILNSRKCIDLICYSLCCLCIVNILDSSLCSCNCIIHICYCLSYLLLGNIIICGNCICSGDCISKCQSRISVHRLFDSCEVCIRSSDSLIQRSLINCNDIDLHTAFYYIVIIGICRSICCSESL